jgi:hypothetical protein
MSRRKWNADAQPMNRRCKHPWCSQCRTKRGSNRGNRITRYSIKRLLRKGVIE